MKSGILFAFVFAAAVAQAQTMVVTKVKGNQAVVLVQKGAVSVGQTINNSAGGDDMDSGSMSMPAESGDKGRAHVIGLSSTLATTSATSNGVSQNTQTFNLNGSYGWNYQTWEAGIIGLLRYAKSGSGSATDTYGAGGFYNYNFEKNRPGVNTIWGVSAQATYSTSPGSSGAASSNTIDLFPSLFGKFFIFGSSTALRVDIGYDNNQTTSGSNKNTLSGLQADAGFAVYF